MEESLHTWGSLGTRPLEGSGAKTIVLYIYIHTFILVMRLSMIQLVQILVHVH